MAKPRRNPSTVKVSPYERRLAAYLKKHPGATRQEARGHRLPDGVRSEYERRTAGLAPGSEERRRKAGHRGKADFMRNIREGDVIVCYIDTVKLNPATKRFSSIPKVVIPASGKDHVYYRIKGQTRKSLRELIRYEIKQGVIFSATPSLDQRRLLPAADRRGLVAANQKAVAAALRRELGAKRVKRR